MRLTEENIKVSVSGDMSEQSFSIHDQGMIFSILRNQMYSDPVSAIAREICCNARDAQREVGKGDLPITVILPNAFSSVLKICDKGPGISPERMTNVFLRYAASTKRNDNTQTGGFGLGAKTPFSYSDTFNIVTVFNKVKYNYSCYIDETKVGKISLMNEEPTTDENGTEIHIPIEKKDYAKFEKEIFQATKWFNPLPEVVGALKKFEKTEKFISGSSWFMLDQNKSSYNGHHFLIDGIEYKANMEKYSHKFSDNACPYKNYNLYLEFGIGELSLSANRESVYYDDATIAKIVAKYEQMSNEVQSQLQNEVDSCASYREAYNKAVKIRANFGRNFNFTYNKEPVEILASQENDFYCRIYYTDRMSNGLKQGAGFTSSREILEDDCFVIIGDDDNVSTLRTKSFENFIEENKYNRYFVVELNSAETQKEANANRNRYYYTSSKVPQMKELSNDEIVKKFNFDKFNILYMKDVPIVQKKHSKTNEPRLSVFKFYNIGERHVVLSSIAEFKNAKNKLVWHYSENKTYSENIKYINSSEVFANNTHASSLTNSSQYKLFEQINLLNDNKDTTIFLVSRQNFERDSFKKMYTKDQELKTFFENLKVSKNICDSYTNYVIANEIKNNKYYLILSLLYSGKDDKNDNSNLSKIVKYVQEMQNNCIDSLFFDTYFKLFSKPDVAAEKVNNEIYNLFNTFCNDVDTKYKMLRMIFDSYYYNYIKLDANVIYDYMNEMDKIYKNRTCF